MRLPRGSYSGGKGHQPCSYHQGIPGQQSSSYHQGIPGQQSNSHLQGTQGQPQSPLQEFRPPVQPPMGGLVVAINQLSQRWQMKWIVYTQPTLGSFNNTEASLHWFPSNYMERRFIPFSELEQGQASGEAHSDTNINWPWQLWWSSFNILTKLNFLRGND